MISHEELQELSSIEAEFLLTDMFALLQQPKHLKPIEEKLVGSFWDPTWLRAPFEECLTFKQLLSVGLDNIVRKKTTNAYKMGALAHAIKRALEKKPRKKALPKKPLTKKVKTAQKTKKKAS